MKIKNTALAIMAFSVLATVSSQGAVLWTNPITGTSPGLENPFTTGQTVIDDITVSGIGRAGVNGNNGNNRYNTNGWDTATIDLDRYITFTLTPDTGVEINFENFTYTGQASGTGPTSVEFRSSVDSFANGIGSPTITGTTISLAGASFQGVDSAIEFRLYASGASGGGGTFSVNDFTFNGEAIPEPSTALLGGLGLLALLRRRR